MASAIGPTNTEDDDSYDSDGYHNENNDADDNYGIIYESSKETATNTAIDGDSGHHRCLTSLSALSSSSFLICPICDGKRYIHEDQGLWRVTECTFCNGTGGYTKAAATFMKIHPCQCVNTSDRKNCPFCKQKCHHNANNKPRVLIITSPPP